MSSGFPIYRVLIDSILLSLILPNAMVIDIVVMVEGYRSLYRLKDVSNNVEILA